MAGHVPTIPRERGENEEKDYMKPADIEHLFWDGRHYDLQFKDFSEDIPFYVRCAKKYGGPVLELACGTGRIAIPLAREGFQVTGLDASKSMLEEARQKAAAEGVDVEWVESDCRGFQFDKKFGTILFPFSTIAVLHDLDSVEACFSAVRNHLKNNGRFILHALNPRMDYLTRDPTQRFPVTEYPDPNGKGQIIVTESNVYDRASQINYIKWYYKIGNEPKEQVEELNMRMFFPQELDALLWYNGFAIEAKFGDYDETSFESNSKIQLIVCCKR